MYETILVGTDGSESAQKAVEKAISTAEQHGATLHAVSVVNTDRYGEPALSSTELVLNEIEERGHEELAEIERLCEERNVDVEVHSVHGNPAEVLVTHATEIDADLIVIGYRGRTHSRAKIGSTADQVVRSADHEVLLV